MAGQLSDKYMDTLEKWIGTGPKTVLLRTDVMRRHSIRNATTKERPLLCFIINPSLYTGATQASRGHQGGNYFNDGSAFLFKLQFNGQPGETKFSRNGNGNDVYDILGYGPTFGGGHDMHTFNGTVTNNAGLFPLNGYLEIGYSYSTNNVQVAQVHNGTMAVTELEVYKVSGEKKCINNID